MGTGRNSCKGGEEITMKKVFLTPEQNRHLYMYSYVFADGYLYNRTEFYTFVRVERIHENFLGTKASKSEKSDENPNGWERVEILVKSGENYV